jgi:hypothetical protein
VIVGMNIDKKRWKLKLDVQDGVIKDGLELFIQKI